MAFIGSDTQVCGHSSPPAGDEQELTLRAEDLGQGTQPTDGGEDSGTDASETAAESQED